MDQLAFDFTFQHDRLADQAAGLAPSAASSSPGTPQPVTPQPVPPTPDVPAARRRAAHPAATTTTVTGPPVSPPHLRKGTGAVQLATPTAANAPTVTTVPTVRPVVRTFAELDAFIEAQDKWPKKLRGELRSACRRVAWSVVTLRARQGGGPLDPDLASLDLANVAFDIPAINATWQGRSYPEAGFASEKSFRNVRSLFRKVCVELGVVAKMRRPPLAADDPFQPLLVGANAKQRSAVQNFVHWLHDNGCHDPSAVEPGILDEYATALHRYKVGTGTCLVIPVIDLVWRRTAMRDPIWPAIPLRPEAAERRFYPDLSIYPESFIAALDRWCDEMRGAGQAGPFTRSAYKRALRPATIKLKRQLARIAAGVLVHAGRDPDSIVDLSCLVEPDAMEEILTAVWIRATSKHAPEALSDAESALPQGSAMTTSMASALMSIAHRHLRLSPDALAPLRELARSVRKPPQDKPNEKVVQRLAQFDDDVVRGLLLSLPARLMARADRMFDKEMEKAKAENRPAEVTVLRYAARLARAAVMFAILLRIPLRIANLTTIRIGTNLKFAGRFSDVATLEFKAHETKNRVNLQFAIGTRLREILQTYIQRYRPWLCPDPSQPMNETWLFPAGKCRPGVLSKVHAYKVITQTAKAEVGAMMYPHLFRHLACKFALERDPGSLEQCRLLLGDKEWGMVMRHYAVQEEAAAARRHDALIDAEERRLAQTAPPRMPSRARSRS